MLNKTKNDICEVVYCWHVTLGLLNVVVLAVTVQSMHQCSAKGDVRESSG